MAVLNEAVDKLSTPAQQSYWIDVNVDIATSHIKITDIKVWSVQYHSVNIAIPPFKASKVTNIVFNVNTFKED